MIQKGLALAPLLGLLVLAALPSEAQKTVSYLRDVQPILKKHCSSCHSNGAKQGDFSLDSREAILTGGKTHPVVRPGKGAQSYLIALVTKGTMPPQGAHLTPHEVDVLRRWIDAGVPFDGAAESPDAAWIAPLAPRTVAVPAGAGNPIDRLLAPYFTAERIRAGNPVSDRLFVRRAYLDLIGLLPTPTQLNAFLQDPRPDKRVRLVESLLADTKNYAEHWLTFWNDALRNDYVGTGYIDGGRSPITGWLYAALENNKPYDQFVRELIDPPTPESAGFIKGIVWRGVVNASQRPPLQAAQNIGQVFLGVNLKCASCHDSFTSNWKLRDAYGLAAVFSETPLELVRCDKPTGTLASAQFLWPELGKIEGSAPLATRRRQLAAALTAKNNGRFARVIVNRLWTKLMGRGLVEPNDELDHKPWNPALLDWLASDFVAHGYDLKHTLRQIATSRAYQLPSQPLPKENLTHYVFSGPAVKRLSAEQLADGISTLTAQWPTPAESLRINKGVVSVPAPMGKLLFDSGLLRTGSKPVEVPLESAQELALVTTDEKGNGSRDAGRWSEPHFVFADGRQQSLAATAVLGTPINGALVYAVPRGATGFRARVEPSQGTARRFAVVAARRSLLAGRAALTTADALTRALGRPNREQTVTQRQSTATTLEALELTNGALLAGRLQRGAALWHARAQRGEDVLVGLYQSALGRLPTDAEREAARSAGATRLTQENLEDLLWALLMSPEFQLY